MVVVSRSGRRKRWLLCWEDAIDSATQALEKYNIESLEQTCEWSGGVPGLTGGKEMSVGSFLPEINVVCP